MPKKRADKPQQTGLAVINDSANCDMVVRPGRPYVMSDGRTVDLTDREKYPLATDHQRFALIQAPKSSQAHDSRRAD